MSSRRRIVTVGVGWIALSLSLIGCGGATAECPLGTERCGCYGNNTCEEGLMCLSNHCVDPTPDLDAAVDAATAEQTASSEQPDETPSDDASRGPNEESSASSASPADGTSRPTSPRETSATESDPSNPSSTLSPETVTGTPETSTSSEAPDQTGTNQTGETTTSESAAPNATLDTSASDTSTGQATADDTTSSEPLTIPALPEPATTAIDDFAPQSAPEVACSAGFDPDDVCYEALACAEDVCTATLEWTWAAGAGSWANYWFQLRDVSGDGTVALGSWRAENYSIQHTALLRWGTSSATLIAGSSPTAINFDATAAVGALDGGEDWQFVRWTRTLTEELPTGLGTPYDISHGKTVVGLDRVDGVLRGFVWTSGTPTYASTLGLWKISGDGNYAAGLPDGGPVVLFYANGTKSIPSTANLRPDVVTDVNTNGTVVVGYGWSQAALRSPMYRWRVSDEEVDVVAPLTGFQTATPFGASNDGEIIVGANQNGDTYGPKEETEAFYWDDTSGMRPMVDEVIARGISVPSDLWLSTARIAGDGTTVIGEGYKGTSRILWRARLAR